MFIIAVAAAAIPKIACGVDFYAMSVICLWNSMFLTPVFNFLTMVYRQREPAWSYS